MSKTVAKRLVIDTSVAGASGSGDSLDATSKGCREFLLIMKDGTKHQEQEIPGLSLDNTHIAYEDFGLITFHTTPDGVVSSLEWWTNLFTPMA